LRYASGWQLPAKRLKWLFKKTGGIAGCARKYAVNNKTARRKNSGGQNNTIHRQRGLGEIPKLNTAGNEGLKPQE
jgi:hypothetical protein